MQFLPDALLLYRKGRPDYRRDLLTEHREWRSLRLGRTLARQPGETGTFKAAWGGRGMDWGSEAAAICGVGGGGGRVGGRVGDDA